MNFSQFKKLALTAALLILVGCASAPKPSEYVNQPSSKLAAVVGNAAVGDTIQLPADNALGMDSVVVDRTYFAASGRECRRLRDLNGTPIQRVACKGADGQWGFARNLSPVSSLQTSNQIAGIDNSAPQSIVTQPLIPSAGSALLLNEDEPFAVELVPNELMSDESTGMTQRALNVNETLWSFAKRTTGNALNWKTIAELNNITDAKTLAPGAQLNIPVALVGEGG